MAWGNFHALALLSAVFATLWVVGFSPRRPTFGRALGGVLAGLLLGFASLTVSLHLCDSGTPFLQWAVPSLGVAALIAAARPSRLRASTLAALAFGSFALSLHYSALVHEPGYFGRPDVGPFRHALVTPFWHSPLTGLYERTELATPRTDPAAF